ncbi:MAG: hypothetical protein H6659_10940 [Ardenticatenaceae bacterium]|nr:hypothetical protein [Ardenticatenaceae bacterium]
MSFELMPFVWVALAFMILLFLQRWIHTHLHGLSLLISGKPQYAVILYAIILLPGVVLHEVSHWLAASLLGVRTGKLSIIPRVQTDGSIQLGYVEYYKGRTLGPIRESIIGGAPLISGTLVILLIGFRVFNVEGLTAALQTGDVDRLTLALSHLFQTNDFFVWLYLLFAICNAMMPSASDRRAWPAFLLTMLVVAVIAYLLGLADVVIANLAGPVVTIFGYLGVALSMAIAVDLVFIVLIAVLEGIISRVKGVSVRYRSDTGVTDA